MFKIFFLLRATFPELHMQMQNEDKEYSVYFKQGILDSAFEQF